jgi:hypothetical protein
MTFSRRAQPKKRRRKRRKTASKSDFAARMAKARAAKARKHRKAPKRKASKRRKRRSKAVHGPKISAATLRAAMEAYSGEGRHGAPVYKKYKPKRRRRSSIVLSENPIHFPKTARGRPSRVRFWILDVYKGSKISSYIGRADKTTAERDAMRKLVRLRADRVALSGPYLKKPHLSSARK